MKRENRNMGTLEKKKKPKFVIRDKKGESI